MTKVKLALYRRTDDGMADFGVDVHDSMLANAATFPDSAADITALATENTAYATALEAARQGKIAQQALIDAKDAARAAVQARLRKLGRQVDDVANGVVEIIHLAGMQGSDDPAPVSLGQVTDLRVTPSPQAGELIADWKPDPDAVFYKVQVSLDAGAPVNWVDKSQPTASKCALNHDLVSASKVWVRVCACAAKVMGPWSDAVQKTVP